MNLLADLTDEQREAVTHVEGPLLVLAGAGSGKTRVVTRRVAYLMEQGVSPRNILAITFTNKAAGEMQERVEQLVPGSRVWVSTFHKFCARLLRIYGDRVGLGDGYVIYDTSDRTKVIKDALEQVGIDRAHLSPERVEAAISRAKNDLLDPDAYLTAANDFFHMNVAKVYRAYQQQLVEANAVDFDDLLLYVARLLRDNAELRAELDERYRFVLVDEYQDTNLAQYAIVRGLSVDHANICATGDPDQSIYGWRGANLNNILQFESDFPGTRVVRLEKNYRSTKSILASASQLIRFNRRRKAKDLITDNPAGPPVCVTQHADEREEAQAIAARIRAAAECGGRSLGDFAVFCRVAALTRALEMAFATEGVPYQILSGVAFYERAEVKDLLAYLKLLVNPRDDVAFARVVNVPPRGIGKTTLDRLQVEATRLGLPLLETARRLVNLQSAISRQQSATSNPLPLTTHDSPPTSHHSPPTTDDSLPAIRGLKPRQEQALHDFVRLVNELTALGDRCVEEVMNQVLARTRYFEAQGATPETDERRANVEELLTAARQYDAANPDGSLVHFLTESVLTTDLDSWDPSRQAVSIMTLHAAKGLEFPVVFIVAVEEGILPHSRSREDDADLEEERRLLFVGMTRAKEELSISYVRRREFRGKSLAAIPSPFLRELSVRSSAEFSARESASTRANREPPTRLDEPAARAAASRPLITTGAELAGAAPVAPPAAVEFREGMLVRHPAFGLGRIAALSGYGEHARAKVRFTAGDERTFVISKSPLCPVKAG